MYNILNMYVNIFIYYVKNKLNLSKLYQTKCNKLKIYLIQLYV